jgi:hypothetical protein
VSGTGVGVAGVTWGGGVRVGTTTSVGVRAADDLGRGVMTGSVDWTTCAWRGGAAAAGGGLGLQLRTEMPITVHRAPTRTTP